MRELVQEAAIVVHLLEFLVLLVHIGERTVALQAFAFGLVERDGELSGMQLIDCRDRFSCRRNRCTLRWPNVLVFGFDRADTIGALPVLVHSTIEFFQHLVKALHWLSPRTWTARRRHTYAL